MDKKEETKNQILEGMKHTFEVLLYLLDAGEVEGVKELLGKYIHSLQGKGIEDDKTKSIE